MQLIDEETPLTMKSKTTMGLQQYRPVGKTSVKVDYYGDLEMNEIKNLIKGRRKGDKQTDIGRTMAMFREYVEVTEGEWKDEKDEREHNKLFIKSMKAMPGSPKQKKIIQQMNALRKKNGLELLDEAKRVPKTRKNQDPDTHSDLYTDENPEGTIHGLGFKDVETAEASVRKIKASDRTHAHKIQAAIAMEQRAKVMKKTAEAAVYRNFIEEMKKKTKEMNEEAYLPGQATTSHGGKSGRGGKPGPRMSRQRKNRAAVLDHLILNGIQVLNQPADVRQKGSSDTFVVAKKDLKRAKDVVDDYFSKKYVRMHMAKNQLRRENYKIIAEGVNEESNPPAPGTDDAAWYAMLQNLVYNIENGPAPGQDNEEFVRRHDWNGDGQVDFNDIVALQSYWASGEYVGAFDGWDNADEFFALYPHLLPIDSQHPLRLEINAQWEGGLASLRFILDNGGTQSPGPLNYYYDWNGDGIITEADYQIMYDVWQQGGYAIFAYDYINTFAPPSEPKRERQPDIKAKPILPTPPPPTGPTPQKANEGLDEVYKDSGLGKWFGKGGGGGVEKGGWDRYNASGDRIGKCGDAPKGAAYSACLSAEKAKQLGKEGRAKFVQRKRDAQKKAGDKAKGGESKKGQKPVMVKTGAKGLDKKNESFMSFRDFISEGENKPNNPALWKKAIAKAKEKFDVYPSAYANAWASKWYKSKGGTWSKK